MGQSVTKAEFAPFIDSSYSGSNEERIQTHPTLLPPALRRRWRYSGGGSCMTHTYEGLLKWAVISMGAYAGAFIRVGFSYYRGFGPIPSGFTVLYAELLGCAIMGAASEWQSRLMAGRRIERLLYVFVTTGLCGSITTFSTWHFETSKLFLSNLDHTPGSLRDLYSGGKLLTWLVTLWLGWGLPFTALVGGQHAAQAVEACISHRRRSQGSEVAVASPDESERLIALKRARPEALLTEALIVVAYIVTTIAVIGVPIWTGWTAFAWTAGFGAVGAYIRYRLSSLNKAGVALFQGLRGTELHAFLEPFPMGTFLANVVGTTVQAVVSSASRFAVSYHDHEMQSFLYGVSVGFCGCLTTLSSFVLELQRLPRGASYLYGFASYAVAILVTSLFFIVPAAYYATVAANAPLTDGPHVYLCSSYPLVCSQLLDHVDCPPAARVVGGCMGAGVEAFNASCRCGGFDASERVAEHLIDAQTRSRVSGSIVPVWAGVIDAGGARGDDASEGIDACLSHANLCGNLLFRLSCPASQRRVNSCSRRGLKHYVGQCECGGLSTGSRRVSALIADHLLARRYDVLPYGGFPALPDPRLDLCSAAASACTDLLDHVLCPPGDRVIPSCSTPGNVSTLNVACTCFAPSGYSVGTDRVSTTLVDASARAWTWGAIVRLRTDSGGAGGPVAIFDACASFTALCALWHTTIGCPAQDRRVLACNGNASAPEVPSTDAWIGTCACGAYDAGGVRARTWLIDAALAADVYDYTFIAPPMPAFELIVSSSPSTPLLLSDDMLPGDT